MKQLFIFFFCLSPTLGFAQSVGPSTLNATGNSVNVGGNTYEYAIGGMLSGETYTSSGLVVTPGVLQPMQATTGVTTPGIAASDLSVFPNPAANILYIQPGFNKKGVLEYMVTDVLGRALATRKVTLEKGNERQEVNMTAFAAGQYHLSITWQQQGKIYRSTYKVQKIN